MKNMMNSSTVERLEVSADDRKELKERSDRRRSRQERQRCSSTVWSCHSGPGPAPRSEPYPSASERKLHLEEQAHRRKKEEVRKRRIQV